ncbi:MAG: LacI family transcriptional regulator [Spirochaetaceae bacterium]
MKDLSRKKIVIDDVAKRAEVSTATVSRVINGFDGVSADVSFRVNSAIEELGYIRPTKNRDRSSISQHVGIVVPNIENPYSANLIKEIQNTFYNFGYKVSIMDSRNDPDKSMECVDSLIKIGVTGLIYIPTHTKCKQELRLESIELPIVCLGRKVDIKGICFVGSETYTGAYNAANYLLSLGHKDVLYITGDRDTVLNINDSCVDQDGYNGFIKAFEEKGIIFNQNNLISGDYDMITTAEGVKKLLLNRTFSAIFTSGDVMAYGAYKAAISSGLSIPEDISILGFDDLPMSSVLDLTTISQNAFGIGQNAGLLLHDLIEERKTGPQEIILATNLCLRSSCGINKNS